MAGKLYLIPTLISEDAPSGVIPEYAAKIAGQLRIFFVEEEKSARRSLKKMIPSLPLPECTFFLLNEHTKAGEIQQYLENILNKDAGVISEAGCPCVADPGADVVLLAHQNHMEVIPLIGPSAVFLALMASGLNGQNFAFHGYLSKDKDTRAKKLKELERRSLAEQQTQIFMEAPYHNDSMLDDILAVCARETLLCVACDLTAPTQFIKTMLTQDWKKQKPLLNKRPALFLIQKKN